MGEIVLYYTHVHTMNCGTGWWSSNTRGRHCRKANMSISQYIINTIIQLFDILDTT